MSRKLAVGDKVILTHPAYNRLNGWPLNGVVRYIDSRGSVGVEFPGWTKGYSINGRLTGNRKNSGWFCAPDELEIVDWDTSNRKILQGTEDM